MRLTLYFFHRYEVRDLGNHAADSAGVAYDVYFVHFAAAQGADNDSHPLWRTRHTANQF